jgi:hypothetical protein
MFHATFASADQKEGMAAFLVRLLIFSDSCATSGLWHAQAAIRKNDLPNFPINENRGTVLGSILS